VRVVCCCLRSNLCESDERILVLRLSDETFEKANQPAYHPASEDSVAADKKYLPKTV
jgi:hypothetical protein